MLKKINTSAAVLTAIMFLVPSLSYAICLQNCQKEAARIQGFSNGSRLDEMTSGMPRPARNIEAGDVKNSVFGDMNIRVGHERVDIRTESNSNNNTIEAGINSTIILGDMNK